MRINETTILTSPEYKYVPLSSFSNDTSQYQQKFLFLVPYRQCHIPIYHEWMRSNDLLKATASEPLSLKEEYEMQASWLNDTDKLTFILLYRTHWDPSSPTLGMIGDVNLFFNDPTDLKSAEIEVMIAEPKARGLGLATQSLIWMMKYSMDQLGVQTFKAQIGWDNVASQTLFTKKLGFQKVKSIDVFQETLYELNLSFMNSSYPIVKENEPYIKLTWEIDN